MKPGTVGVIGGGTAGYFAAIAIKRRFPEMSVTVVQSSAVPIIGVGEATTTLMPPFLHHQLGLSPETLWQAVNPTFKLGIKFEWGLPGDYFFTYPFGSTTPIEAFALDRDLRSQSLVSQLMCADRAPILQRPDGSPHSLLPQLKFAYHLDNAPFVACLERTAAAAGIACVDMKISSVRARSDGGGIEAVCADDGRELKFDFFVDATGFRSLLLEHGLGSPFISYASSLFADRAIVATVPQHGPIEPYTTAETMDAGWCWRIPTPGEDHRGYVHSSSFLSEDAALDEMRRKNPGLGDPRVVRFRSGRHRDFWIGNTVAVGNAYGFVEPLESTALHMVIIEIGYLLEGMEKLEDPEQSRSFASSANEAVGAHWDYLRWFLAVHYKFNRRLDTAFWRAARSEVDISGLDRAVDHYRQNGPWIGDEGTHFEPGDPAFGYHGLMLMLLGQQVPTEAPLTAKLTREEWNGRLANEREVVARALPHAEALQALHARPELLRAISDDPESWCRTDGETALVLPRAH